MAKVLVVGASRGIGLETVKAALRAGHSVRALARSAAIVQARILTRILVDAMKAAGAKRLIVVTGLGAGDSRGHGGLLYDAVVFPLLLKRFYDDKDVQE